MQSHLKLITGDCAGGRISVTQYSLDEWLDIHGLIQESYDRNQGGWEVAEIWMVESPEDEVMVTQWIRIKV